LVRRCYSSPVLAPGGTKLFTSGTGPPKHPKSKRRDRELCTGAAPIRRTSGSAGGGPLHPCALSRAPAASAKPANGGNGGAADLTSLRLGCRSSPEGHSDTDRARHFRRRAFAGTLTQALCRPDQAQRCSGGTSDAGRAPGGLLSSFPRDRQRPQHKDSVCRQRTCRVGPTGMRKPWCGDPVSKSLSIAPIRGNADAPDVAERTQPQFARST
jgi:hypothetical protein